jgi:hypothetical protein
VPKDGKEKFGLWEDGKRIEWFSEEQVNQINSNRMDYSTLFSLSNSDNMVVHKA